MISLLTPWKRKTAAQAQLQGKHEIAYVVVQVDCWTYYCFSLVSIYLLRYVKIEIQYNIVSQGRGIYMHLKFIFLFISRPPCRKKGFQCQYTIGPVITFCPSSYTQPISVCGSNLRRARRVLRQAYPQCRALHIQRQDISLCFLL